MVNKKYMNTMEMSERLEKNLNKLSSLDAQYLTGYPRNIPESEYKERRLALKKKFMKLKKEADMLSRG